MQHTKVRDKCTSFVSFHCIRNFNNIKLIRRLMKTLLSRWKRAEMLTLTSSFKIIFFCSLIVFTLTKTLWRARTSSECSVLLLRNLLTEGVKKQFLWQTSNSQPDSLGCTSAYKKKTCLFTDVYKQWRAPPLPLLLRTSPKKLHKAIQDEEGVWIFFHRRDFKFTFLCFVYPTSLLSSGRLYFCPKIWDDFPAIFNFRSEQRTKK